MQFSTEAELASGSAGALRTDFLEFAATLIQSAFRGYVQRKSYTSLARITRSLAATILQRAWRAFSGKKTLAYFKGLIALHERSDPKEVLKMVNPREADIMDAAAGLHVRFRLDGTDFPPRLMYKIFTHRPIADICAFGPRDYAGATLAATTASSVGVHHTQQAVFSPSPRSELHARQPDGWYQRHENNSWRHVDSSRMANSGTDCLARSRSQPVFHYSTKVRAAQRLHQQKMRRREWLVALYSQHIPQEQGDRPNQGEEDLDLMQWCAGLDFDQYMHDWRGMATTMASDAFVPAVEILPELPAWSGYIADIPQLESLVHA